MRRWLRYLAAAFSARPLGMPVPPNWFGVAASVMLGALAHPGFYLIGLGLEVAYLGVLLSSRRFRNVVDADSGEERLGWQAERLRLLKRLPKQERRDQEQLEAHCAVVARRLAESGTAGSQIDDLARLCWLHLRLLASRQGIGEVVRSGTAQASTLEHQARQLEGRLADEGLTPRLRQSLEEQREVIEQRQSAHADAHRRLEVIEAELERIRQQVSLVHERALLASDAGGITDSIDVISASLNEAGRWLDEQQALFGPIDEALGESPDASLFELHEKE